MKIWHIRIIALSSIFFLSAFAGPKKKFFSRHKKRLFLQQDQSCSERDHIFAAIEQAFYKMPTIAETLFTAYELFETTPGFKTVLQKVLDARDEGSRRGYLFEIEKAIALEMYSPDDNGSEYTVVAFSKIITSSRSGKEREFDLVAQQGDTLIYFECKDRSWKKTTGSYCEQFQDQKAIIDELRSCQEEEVSYIVSSKQPISDEWKKFFLKHAIDFEEEWNYGYGAQA